MDERAREALLGSIFGKWENILKGTPYESWGESKEINPFNVEYALEMQEFLISLLPQKDIDNLETLYKEFIINKRR